MIKMYKHLPIFSSNEINEKTCKWKIYIKQYIYQAFTF